MKNYKKIGLFLGLALILGAVGCAPTTNPTTNPSIDLTEPSVEPTTDPTVDPTEPSVEPTIDPTIDPTEPSVDPVTPTTLTVTVKNILGEVVKNPSITIGTNSFTGGADGVVNIEFLEETEMTISADGFEPLTVAIPKSNVEVVLALNYAHVGKLVDKDWPLYERFNTHVTRNEKGLMIRHTSDSNVFLNGTRSSQVETYVSVGDTSTRDGNAGVFKITQESNGNWNASNFGGAAVTGITSEAKTINDLTVIDMFLPFATLGVEKDAIIGVTNGLWSNDDSDWAPMVFGNTTELAAVETPSAYVRCDINNAIFRNTKNEYPKEAEYNKDELIAGKPYNTGNPEATKFAAADDIYFSVNNTATGFEFDMVGFGSFEDNEYIKFVFHTSETDASGWGTQASDLSVLVSKSQAKYRTGLTDFWAYTNFGNDTATANQPEYNFNDKGYFTLKWTLNYNEIPEYSATGEVSFIAIEFGNGIIYNNDPWINAMMKNGKGIGDPASQTSYQVIQEKAGAVDRESLTKDYNIQFSFIEYAKFERRNDGLLLSLLSFDKLGANQYIRFICDTDGNPTSGVWELDAKDVSFTIYSDRAYIETGKTSFWDNEAQQFHPSNIETLNPITYNDFGEYWTIDLLIDYTELGLNVNADSPLNGLLLLFNPTIQNGGFNYNGNTAPGDQAIQKNYFKI